MSRALLGQSVKIVTYGASAAVHCTAYKILDTVHAQETGPKSILQLQFNMSFSRRNII